MYFWCFMLICNLLIPVTMIFFGKCFKDQPLGEINDWYGYRTKMSRKNKATWEFAHRYFGKIWFYGGFVLFLLILLCQFLLWGKDKDTIGNLGLVIVAIQCIFMCAGILPTEKALRKHFDENGYRKDDL